MKKIIPQEKGISISDHNSNNNNRKKNKTPGTEIIKKKEEEKVTLNVIKKWTKKV